MTQFLARRALQSMVLLLVISALVFVLLHAVPGGPLAVYLANPSVRPEDVERLRRALGLDRPLSQQYASWLIAFVRGDWGYSLSDGRPVIARIFERVPASLELIGVATLVAVTLTLPAGIYSAIARRGAFDRFVGAAAMAAISLPAFWFGLVLQLVFAVGLGWLPSSGRTVPGGGDLADHVSHLLLPATVLAVLQAASWSRYLRASMVDVLAQPFVAAAAARGIPPRRIVLRHALKNALGPVIAVVMVDAALLVSGAVVTESVFAWPGLGSLFTDALGRRDYSVLMALLMLTSAAIVVLNLVADLAHAAIDPRVTPP